jgi:hypothetical protein
MPKVTSRPAAKATVRMYRQGVGDCHLITLHTGPKPFHIMIDCGVIQGADEAAVAKLGDAIKDIAKVTNNRVDVLVISHEHWDHVSGFVQHADLLAPVEFGQVWLGWPEDPADPLAQKLAGDRGKAVAGLTDAVTSKDQNDDADSKVIMRGVRGVLDFFGATGRQGTTDAMSAARKKGPVRYLRPGDAPWTSEEVPGVRIFTLGPPRDERAIKQLMVKGEVYGAADDALEDAFYKRVRNEPDADDALEPFEPEHRMDLEALRKMQSDPAHAQAPLVEFFRDHYFATDGWRNIDGIWLEAAQEFALRLDNATNNTSLVLAIDVEGDVLLFAADAQVGSWLSWQDLKWQVGGKTVTGPELLNRTVFYKVGHHGSHNATLRQKGLEQMKSEKLVAFIPVDEKMARAKGWGRMPLPALVDALDRQTAGRVVRSDRDAEKPGWVTQTGLYFEFHLR